MFYGLVMFPPAAGGAAIGRQNDFVFPHVGIMGCAKDTTVGGEARKDQCRCTELGQ
jgi:hypothetical protein